MNVLNWPPGVYGPPEPISTSRIQANKIEAGSITSDLIMPIEWPSGFAADLADSIKIGEALQARRQSRPTKRSLLARLIWP